MSHKQARVIEAIFKDPPSANIHWREVESLLHHLGATVETTRGAKLHAILNGIEGVLHRPHHGGECTRQEIKHIREFLAAAGVTPSRYELGE
jgi:hypothetical protein